MPGMGKQCSRSVSFIHRSYPGIAADGASIGLGLCLGEAALARPVGEHEAEHGPHARMHHVQVPPTLQAVVAAKIPGGTRGCVSVSLCSLRSHHM
jgi:hypothetical protein